MFRFQKLVDASSRCFKCAWTRPWWQEMVLQRKMSSWHPSCHLCKTKTQLQIFQKKLSTRNDSVSTLKHEIPDSEKCMEGSRTNTVLRNQASRFGREWSARRWEASGGNEWWRRAPPRPTRLGNCCPRSAHTSYKRHRVCQNHWQPCLVKMVEKRARLFRTEQLKTGHLRMWSSFFSARVSVQLRPAMTSSSKKLANSTTAAESRRCSTKSLRTMCCVHVWRKIRSYFGLIALGTDLSLEISVTWHSA